MIFRVLVSRRKEQPPGNRSAARCDNIQQAATAVRPGCDRGGGPNPLSVPEGQTRTEYVFPNWDHSILRIDSWSDNHGDHHGHSSEQDEQAGPRCVPKTSGTPRSDANGNVVVCIFCRVLKTGLSQDQDFRSWRRREQEQAAGGTGRDEKSKQHELKKKITQSP